VGDGEGPGVGAIDSPGVSAQVGEVVRLRLDDGEGHGDGGIDDHGLGARVEEVVGCLVRDGEGHDVEMVRE
jgi:hypothetical protein